MNTIFKTDIKDKLLAFCQDNLELKGKKFICPYCGSGTGKNGTPAFSLFDDNTRFKCFSCGMSGDIYDLAKYLNITQKQLNETYSLQATQNPKIKIFQTKSKTINTNLDQKKKSEINENQADYSENFKEWAKAIKNCDYLTKRGISWETQKRFNIGYCKEWKHPKVDKAPASERVIIPTSKYSYLARAIRESVKKDFQKQKVGKVNIFNTQALKISRDVFILEGEIDALSLEDLGFNAVALGSISNKRKLIDILKNLDIKPFLFLCLDNDDAGQNAQNELIELLKEIGVNNFMEANNILGKYKDANEALVANREELKSNIQKVISLKEKQSEQRLSKGEILNEPRANDEKTKEQTMNERRKEEKIKSVYEVAKDIIYNQWEHPIKQYKTGFKQLDDKLGGGFNAGTLSVLGANPSVGKTTLALQMACNMAKAGESVLFFSLEMSEVEIVAKIISRETRENEKEREKWLTTNEILTCNKYTERDVFKQDITLKQILGEWLQNIYIITFKEQASVKDLQGKIKSFIEQKKIEPFVIVDYIHILRPENLRDEKQNIGQIITKLKKTAVNYNIHLMGIIPFNRASVEADLSAGRETSNIEYTADYFIGLDFICTKGKREDKEKREAAQEEKRKPTREVNIKLLKNRNGEVDTIPASYDAKYNFFYIEENGFDTILSQIKLECSSGK